MEEQKTETKGRGKKGKSEKVDKNGFLLTHRCDGAILSDRCGDDLYTVRTQAVRRYIELLYRGVVLDEGSKNQCSINAKALVAQVQAGDGVLSELLDGTASACMSESSNNVLIYRCRAALSKTVQCFLIYRLYSIYFRRMRHAWTPGSSWIHLNEVSATT